MGCWRVRLILSVVVVGLGLSPALSLAAKDVADRGDAFARTVAAVSTPVAPGSVARQAASDSTPCVFEAGAVTACSSTNPQVTLNGNFSGSGNGCAFSWNVNWGDGTATQPITLVNPPAGAVLFGTHTYSVVGSYTITASTAGVTGPCSQYGATYQFTLVSPPAPDPTSTGVECSPTSVPTGNTTTCTVTITDTSANSPSAPTGSVSFTASPPSGPFGDSGACTLTATGAAAAACQVTFTPSARGDYTITASYGGDSAHETSSGTSSVSATTTDCDAARELVGRYQKLEGQVEDETEEARRLVDSALKLDEEVKSKPGDVAQEGVIDGLSKQLNQVLGQIKRANTNLASGLWSKASIFEREWAAEGAAIVRRYSLPFLKGVNLVQLFTDSVKLGKLGTIDILLARHLRQLESMEPAYRQAKAELMGCAA